MSENCWETLKDLVHAAQRAQGLARAITNDKQELIGRVTTVTETFFVMNGLIVYNHTLVAFYFGPVHK